MFEISLPCMGIFLIWLVIFSLLFRMKHPSSFLDALRRRSGTLLAALMIFASFFFQSWVEMRFANYFMDLPNTLNDDVIRGIIRTILEHLKIGWLAPFIHTLVGIELTGWHISLMLWLGWRLVWVIAPLGIALAALLFLLPSCKWRGEKWIRYLGIAQVVLSLVAMAGLLASLPAIAHLGANVSFEGNMLSDLLAPGLATGPWFTLLGLLMIGVGGLINYFDEKSVQSNWSSDSGDFNAF